MAGASLSPLLGKPRTQLSHPIHTHICKHSLDGWYHLFERYKFRIKRDIFYNRKDDSQRKYLYFLFKFLLPFPTSNRLSNLEKSLLLRISLFTRTGKFMKYLEHNRCSVNTNLFFLMLFFPRRGHKLGKHFMMRYFGYDLIIHLKRVSHFLIHLLIKSRLSTLVSLPWWTRHNLLDIVNTEPGFSSQVVGKFQLQELSTIKGGHVQQGTSTLLTDTDCYFIFGK